MPREGGFVLHGRNVDEQLQEPDPLSGRRRLPGSPDAIPMRPQHDLLLAPERKQFLDRGHGCGHAHPRDHIDSHGGQPVGFFFFRFLNVETGVKHGDPVAGRSVVVPVVAQQLGRGTGRCDPLPMRTDFVFCR